MRVVLLIAAGVSLSLLAFAVATQPTAAPREVNITSDSAPGWLPTVEDERAARKALDDFLAAEDSGRAADAYAVIIEANRRAESLAAYTARLAKFNALAGPVREHQVLKVTWTKDPPPSHAPAPGIYVAFDLASRFEGIDRHCGYVALFRPPTGGPFQVARTETNFIDNASARRIAAEKSQSAVDYMWSELAAHCPNFPPPPLPEAAGDPTGYSSVAAALAGLHAKAGVTFKIEGGWTVATDTAARTLWSFAPAGYPAFPSAVKRQVIEENGTVSIKMSVQCEASKAVCDDLVRTFQKLNGAAVGATQKPR